MQTKFAKHMKALHALAGEVGSIGEDDARYGAVYEKLSDALDAAEQHGLTCNAEMEEDSIRVFYTDKRFGKDSRQGIHLLQPDGFEISRAVEDAQAKGFKKIYIHAE